MKFRNPAETIPYPLNMRILIAVILALLSTGGALAQYTPPEPEETDTMTFFSDNDTRRLFPSRHLIFTPQRPDSADVARDRQKHFWRGAGEVFGLNMALWGLDRYILHGHYAYINLNTIKENFRHGFSWDNDHLSTNMFAHPYNGSLFYEAGRSNGYNFWQSGLFAVAGSAQWELFMEREYPSTNDIIATPIGGAALGEVFYRTSDIFLDDTTWGWERFEREAVAFIIAPMRGITRILSGKSWARRPTSGRRFGLPALSVQVGLGARALLFHDDGNLSKAGGTMVLNVEYGDRYSPASRKPYDYFNVQVELDVIKTQPILNRLEIRGRLLSRDLIDTKKCDLSVGMYQHFDFFDSDTITTRAPENNLKPCVVPYKLGTPASVGAGVMFRHVDEPRSVFEAYGHLNGVFLAGILSDYYRYYHRNYNWASGLSLKTGVSLSLPRQRIQLLLADRFYTLWTWNGWYRAIGRDIEPADRAMDVQGDSSTAFFNYMEFRMNYRVWNRIYATLGVDWYWRHTRYNDLSVYDGKEDTGWYVVNPRITSHQVCLYLMATYEF